MKSKKNICLIMNDNSYVGREYVAILEAKRIFVDILIVGSGRKFDADEDQRCGGLWTPIDQESFSKNFSIYKFKSLADILLLEHLRTTQYGLGIQGGTGILKKCHIDLFSDGILNFHPGDLPLYRGCSAPEYQRVDGKPVVSSCHYLDELIDTGDVVEKRILEVDMSSYCAFRGSIYPLTSQFMADVISRWLSGEEFKTQPQNERLAVYHKYIGDSAIDELRENWTRV